MTCQYRQVLDVICAVMAAPPERRETINSRVKQWQKMGYPRGSNVQRGNRAEYTLEMVWEVALIAELANLGITPQIGGKLVETILGGVMAASKAGSSYPVQTVKGRDSRIVIDAKGLDAVIREVLSCR